MDVGRSNLTSLPFLRAVPPSSLEATELLDDLRVKDAVFGPGELPGEEQAEGLSTNIRLLRRSRMARGPPVLEQSDGELLPRVRLIGPGAGTSAFTSGAGASESTMACESLKSRKLSSDLRRPAFEDLPSEGKDPWLGVSESSAHPRTEGLWFAKSSHEARRELSVRELQPEKKTSSSWTVCNGRSASFRGCACFGRFAPSQEAVNLLRMDDLLPLVLLVAMSDGGGAGDASSLKNEPSIRAERRPLLVPELWCSRWPREPP